jgi:hypothetical protein
VTVPDVSGGSRTLRADRRRRGSGTGPAGPTRLALDSARLPPIPDRRVGGSAVAASPGGQKYLRMTLHEDEIEVDESTVRSLLEAGCPRWADLPLSPAGAGTDNVMYRLGDDLLVRVPRTPEKAVATQEEQQWLPALAPHLTRQIPELLHAGMPTSWFPLSWSVLRWIDGDEAQPGALQDWASLGADLAAFVRELHDVDLMGATSTGQLDWYRGGSPPGRTGGSTATSSPRTSWSAKAGSERSSTSVACPSASPTPNTPPSGTCRPTPARPTGAPRPWTSRPGPGPAPGPSPPAGSPTTGTPIPPSSPNAGPA